MAIAGLTEADLDIACSPGSWTIRQTVHHVVDGNVVWSIGIKAAVGNQNGFFDRRWYWGLPQASWVECWRQYAHRALEPSLTLFQANRRHIVQLLQQIPDAWERSIHIQWPHQPEECISVREIVEMQASPRLPALRAASNWMPGQAEPNRI